MGCLCSKPLQKPRLRDDCGSLGEEGSELYSFNSLPIIQEDDIPEDENMLMEPIEVRFSPPWYDMKEFARNRSRLYLNLLNEGVHSYYHTKPKRMFAKSMSSEETYTPV